MDADTTELLDGWMELGVEERLVIFELVHAGCVFGKTLGLCHDTFNRSLDEDRDSWSTDF